jgi:alpha-beta hydrolase superfamily lysophospholipase
MRRRAFILGASCMAAACAPMRQMAGSPGRGFQGPRLLDDAAVSFDGTRLPMQVWAAQGDPWAVIVGLHGMNDYAATFDLAGPWWAARGVTTYAYDQRGFGRAPQRGVWGGTDLMTEDLRTVTALVRQRHPNSLVVVAGVSMGGSVAIEAFASPRPPPAHRLVLLAPGVWGWSTQPVAYKTLLWIAAHTARGAILEPPDFVLKRIRPTDNIDALRKMSRDPNMIWGTRPDAIYGLVDMMEGASDDIARLNLPTIYMAGENDQIITARPTLRAARGLPPGSRSAYYKDGWHLLLIDKQRERVFEDVLAFIRDPAAALPSGAPPIPARTAVQAGSGQG